MFVLGLVTYIVLRAFSAQAKVVTSFNECNEFFYKATEPRGLDQSAKRICQNLQYGGFYYATLYTVPQRIPLYSAYTFDSTCSNSAGRTDIWHIEPQISQPESQNEHMVLEKDSNVSIIKENQAISSDYSDTGYDRGHLNPNSFQCNEGRTATFTLTNAAPMDACFNCVHWNSWESTLRKFLKNKLASDPGLATAYIVTGQRQITCSPQYSLITVKGKRCLDDHPCATYSYDYYWCKTDHGYIKDDWDYCSPPLWHSKAKNGKYCRSNHACAKYGESQPWCYTDDGKKNECCISSGCFSAVNGKICKSDHPCSYNGLMVALTFSSPDKPFSRCPKQSMRSHLPAAIPEQALHWWHSDPAAESSLGDDPGACWTFLDALKPS
ncbi:endonuclease domain-containing 1 -like protein [Labeo rohita]|uniref:Endonuclease domain-containing 1-like protein n=1 Tax=Labeo rohita TaxID=84645 RepID=A0A498NL79_LABRO|nr:endonuclease domain-containing 1 -like protein [Labeo rohita]